MGLGDGIANLLSAAGVTEDRVAAITGKKDCGCKKRREALNDLGDSWQIYLSQIKSSLCRRYIFWSRGRFSKAARLLFRAIHVLLFGESVNFRKQRRKSKSRRLQYFHKV